MTNNGTLLGIASMKLTLAWLAVILSLLFTVMRPEASAGLSLLPRMLYWSSHVSCALLCIVVASKVLERLSVHSIPVLGLIVAIGLIGAAIATPFFILLEQFFPAQGADDWIDTFSQQGPLQFIVAEYLDVLPIFLASWITINLPLLFNKPHTHDDEPPSSGDTELIDESDALNIRRAFNRAEFLSALPEVVGQDIVAISSDLHYLNVHTTLGRALVLGSLKNCVEFMGDEGIQVHRSNWVSKQHVQRAIITGDQSYCLMSTGLKVPVSRSQRKTVKNMFGSLNTHLHDTHSHNTHATRNDINNTLNHSAKPNYRSNAH